MPKREKPDEIYLPDNIQADINELELDIPYDTATDVVVMTDEERFAQEKSKIEQEIVQQYVYGATIQQIQQKHPKYTAHQIYQLLLGTLSMRQQDEDILTGAGVWGYQDDLKALSDFLDEVPKGSPVKLQTIRIRSETRDKMLKYMQSVKLLPSVQDPLEGLKPKSITWEEERTETRRIKQDFEDADPIKRLEIIEGLERGSNEVPRLPAITEQ